MNDMLFTGAIPDHLLSLYYILKPLIPRSLQIELRRWRCRRMLASRNLSWPTDPTSNRKPIGWPGWPDGKQFALVLTHDVEGQKGARRVRELMDIDERMGFRACFNFVGRGYDIPEVLLYELKSRQFEIGVHGLYHNGLMYTSRKTFQRHSILIRDRMLDWKAVGFRSPSMHRKLEWLHELGIQYDSSTFDTDPFEPQPDGVGTIFPFWVTIPDSHRGYVELPYTLPQDFTLYVILQEKSNAIWKRKLDWIADQGGMALLIVHPDYLHIPGNKRTNYEYPVAFYQDLLEYVRVRHAGQYWAALPEQVASYFASKYPLREKLNKKHECEI